MEEAFTIQIHTPVRSPLKAKDKQQFLNQISEVLSPRGVRNIKYIDLHYVDRRSADAIQMVVATFQAIAPILSVAASSLVIAKMMWEMNKKARIFVKRKDDSYVELTDRMTEKDVKDALNVGRNEEEGGKTEN